jgi:hypothetical protein
MASAFRRAKEQVGHDLGALLDVRVERDVDISELARTFVHIHAETQGEDAEDAMAIVPRRHLPDAAAPMHTGAMARKPPDSDGPHAHKDADDYRLPEGRRHEMLSFMKLHARDKDPFALTRNASDGVVEMTFHKMRGALVEITEAERGESLAWLAARGIQRLSVPLSPEVARQVGLVANRGVTNWVDGSPVREPPGWKNTRRYLPAELPAGWRIFANRGDGGLMVETEDESVIVLKCEKRLGMKTLLLTVGHQRDLPIDADALLRRLRGIWSDP